MQLAEIGDELRREPRPPFGSEHGADTRHHLFAIGWLAHPRNKTGDNPGLPEMQAIAIDESNRHHRELAD